MRRTAIRFRRSPHVIAFWRGARLTIVNYATRQSVGANAWVCRMLDYCGEWRTLKEIQAAAGLPSATELEKLIRALVSRTLLTRSDTAPDAPITVLW